MGITRLKTLKPSMQMQGQRLNTMQPDSWRAGKTTTARGYGYRWQKAREQYLFENPLCERHKERGEVALGTVVDHKVPHRGNMALFWDRNNWQTLCTHCHSSDKQRQEHAAGKR